MQMGMWTLGHLHWGWRYGPIEEWDISWELVPLRVTQRGHRRVVAPAPQWINKPQVEVFLPWLREQNWLKGFQGHFGGLLLQVCFTAGLWPVFVAQCYKWIPDHPHNHPIPLYPILLAISGSSEGAEVPPSQWHRTMRSRTSTSKKMGGLASTNCRKTLGFVVCELIDSLLHPPLEHPAGCSWRRFDRVHIARTSTEN